MTSWIILYATAMVKPDLEQEEEDLTGPVWLLRYRIVCSIDGFVNRLTIDLRSFSGGGRDGRKTPLNSDIYLK